MHTETEKKNFPEFYAFLKENDLRIQSHFSSTDLDCAYGIHHQKQDCNSDIIDKVLYPCICAFDYGIGPWGEWYPNDAEFTAYVKRKFNTHLKKISNKTDIVIGILKGRDRYNAKSYKKLLSREDEYSEILYKMASVLNGTKAGLYAKDKLLGNNISDKQKWAIAYLLADKISDSYRCVEIITSAQKDDFPYVY